MAARVRTSKQTLTLLAAITAKASSWHYGYALGRQTGLQSGTLYPILIRLEEYGWLEKRWEATQSLDKKKGRRPPRRLYRLTAEGRVYALDALSTAHSCGGN